MLSTIDMLAKAKKGDVKPGHKYTSRKPDGKGGWIYEYGDASARQRDKPATPAPADAPAEFKIALEEVAKASELLVGNTGVTDLAFMPREVRERIKADITEQIAKRIERAGYDHDAVLEWADWYDYPLTRRTPPDMALRLFVTSSISAWAESSGDHAVMSVALQLAAQQEFDTSGAQTDHFDFDTKEKVKRTPKSVVKLQRAFLRAQYNETQMVLRMHGLDHVTLYRGMTQEYVRRWPKSSTAKGGIRLQPVSSFSCDFETAYSFATGGDSGGPWSQVVMAVRVPADRVLSTARTGFGCLSEGEFTVLGGVYDAFMADADAISPDDHTKETPDELFFKAADDAGLLDVG